MIMIILYVSCRMHPDKGQTLRMTHRQDFTGTEQKMYYGRHQQQQRYHCILNIFKDSKMQRKVI